MCYHISNSNSTPYKMEDYYGARFEWEENYEPFYHLNGFTHGHAYGIIQEDPSAIEPMRWGIVEDYLIDNENFDLESHWRKLGGKSLNTQCEFVFDNNRTRNAIWDNRCIIPVTGFYESRHVNGTPYPYFIKPKNGDFLSLLGCYTEYDDGMFLFTILTTVANKEMSYIHNTKKRMPIMGHPNLINKWLSDNLKENDIKEIMFTDTNQELEYYTVKKEVNNTRVDTNNQSAFEKVIYPELNSLF